MTGIDGILQHPEFLRELHRIEAFECSRMYCGHGLDHLLDVARISYILNLERGLGLERDMIYAAALLHDIGRAEQYDCGTPHAQAGERIARRILSDSSFSPAHRQEILHAVCAHQGSGERVLAQLVHEADHLSRMCFRCAARTSCKWSDARKNRTITR